MITLIAAIGKNNELGLDNKLLWDIPEDMRHFKDYTLGKVVIMGRKTFMSIGRELPGRRNIVVSSQSLTLSGVSIPVHSIESALSIEHCYNEMVVIGGASLYEQTINLADKLIITHVDAEFSADTFFPKIDDNIWVPTNTVLSGNEQFKYRFVEYTRKTLLD